MSHQNLYKDCHTCSNAEEHRLRLKLEDAEALNMLQSLRVMGETGRVKELNEKVATIETRVTKNEKLRLKLEGQLLQIQAVYQFRLTLADNMQEAIEKWWDEPGLARACHTDYDLDVWETMERYRLASKMFKKE